MYMLHTHAWLSVIKREVGLNLDHTEPGRDMSKGTISNSHTHMHTAQDK